jgi:hypothetical protein
MIRIAEVFSGRVIGCEHDSERIGQRNIGRPLSQSGATLEKVRYSNNAASALNRSCSAANWSFPESSLLTFELADFILAKYRLFLKAVSLDSGRWIGRLRSHGVSCNATFASIWRPSHFSPAVEIGGIAKKLSQKSHDLMGLQSWLIGSVNNALFHLKDTTYGQEVRRDTV